MMRKTRRTTTDDTRRHMRTVRSYRPRYANLLWHCVNKETACNIATQNWLLSVWLECAFLLILLMLSGYALFVWLFSLFAAATKQHGLIGWAKHKRAASKLNVPNNSAGLEEYVDILQVQQLLLDSTAPQPPSANASNTAANALNAARHRPRVNIQKAAEYSTSMVNAACGSTLLQGKRHNSRSVPGENACVIGSFVRELIVRGDRVRDRNKRDRFRQAGTMASDFMTMS